MEMFACNKRGVDKCRENLEDASSAMLKTYSMISGQKLKVTIRGSVLRGRVRPVYCGQKIWH